MLPKVLTHENSTLSCVLSCAIVFADPKTDRATLTMTLEPRNCEKELFFDTLHLRCLRAF